MIAIKKVPTMKHYEDFLIHYGILGQRWGVRRYQNKDGSLTDEGRARYRLSDKRTENKLRRGIAASKQNLKDKAQRADKKKAFLDEKVAEYEKEKRRFRPFNRSQKKIDVSNALARVHRAERLMYDEQREVNLAEKVYRDYARSYERFRKKMIQKYGHRNVKDLRYRDFKASKHYVFENFIDPGITMVSLPGIGKRIEDKYVSDIERRRRLRYI